MRSSNGLVIEGPDDYPPLVPGATQTARLRISMSNHQKGPIVVPVVADGPWPTEVSPPEVRLTAKNPVAEVDVRVTVPVDAEAGDRQVWVRVDHHGSAVALGLPVHVTLPRRRWGALVVGAAATALAGAAAWKAMQPKRRRFW